jgi:hypothetical protein
MPDSLLQSARIDSLPPPELALNNCRYTIMHLKQFKLAALLAIVPYLTLSMAQTSANPYETRKPLVNKGYAKKPDETVAYCTSHGDTLNAARTRTVQRSQRSSGSLTLLLYVSPPLSLSLSLSLFSPPPACYLLTNIPTDHGYQTPDHRCCCPTASN